MEIKYRAEIDGLRTVAVLSVIIYHAEFSLGQGHLLEGGFLGVDIFFVISGFLITSLIMVEHEKTGRFSITNFYERRARRLLPALLTVMLVSLPFAWQYLLTTQLIDFSRSLVASLLFGSNIYWDSTLQEYGAESALLKPFLHTWSLAVEEQFYIVYPIILVAIYHWYRRYTIAVLIAGLLLSLILAEWMTARDASFSFYMLPSRFWELLAGGLLANVMYFHPQKGTDTFLNRTMPILGLILIMHSVIFTRFDSNHPGIATLTPVIGTVLIIWFASEKDIVTRLLSSRLLVSIGLISYSLYLWHYPIFAYGRISDSSASAYDKYEWIFLTFVLSVITYIIIERPFRQKKIITRKLLLVSLLGSISVVSAFSLYSIHHDGVKERFPLLMKIYEKNEFDNEVLRNASWDILKQLANEEGLAMSTAQEPSVYEAEYLWFSERNNTRKILVIGNSHSKDLFNAFYQNKDKFTELEFARFGMHSSIKNEELDALINSPNFKYADTVIFSFRYYDKTIDEIPGLIDTFRNNSKNVVIALNTVEFEDKDGKPIFDWYVLEHFETFSHKELNGIFYENQSTEQDELNSRLREVGIKKNIRVLEKKEYICNDAARSCAGITPDGFKSFLDYGHYTLEGAKYFGERIYQLDWLGQK